MRTQLPTRVMPRSSRPRPVVAAARPPKAPPPRKAAQADECLRLEQLPNIGPSLAADLRLIGVAQPLQLADADPWQLYQRLQQATGKRQDPCVLDSFMAACSFMRGAAPQPWWTFTAERKQRYGDGLSVSTDAAGSRGHSGSSSPLDQG